MLDGKLISAEERGCAEHMYGTTTAADVAAVAAQKAQALTASLAYVVPGIFLQGIDARGMGLEIVAGTNPLTRTGSSAYKGSRF